MAEQPNTSKFEEWRDVPAFEGLYQVSNAGNVKSLARRARVGSGGTRLVRERIMKQYLDRGYRRINLCHPDLGMVQFYVHQLVCSTFHPKPDGEVEVAHFDGDRGNNKVSNLRWATSLENALDKFRHGTIVSVLTERDVREIRRFISSRVTDLARHYGVADKTIAKIVYRKSWASLE